MVNNPMNALFVKQILHSSLTKIVSIAISLIYVPLTLNYLDQEKYGIWITFTTIVNWLALFDVGMGNGLRNKLAEALTHNNYKLGVSLVSSTYAFLGTIFIFVLVLFQLFNPYINWQALLNSKTIDSYELYKITSVIVSFVIIRFILQTITIIDAAHGDSAKAGIIQVIGNIISLFLIWLATIYSEKGNLFLLSSILTIVPVIVYLVYTAFVFINKYKKLRPSFRNVSFHHSKSLVSLSLQFFVVQITATILYSSIPFVITQLYGPNEVTQYNIASSIFNLPIMLITLVCAPVVPLVTQAKARGDNEWLKITLKRLTKISYLFCLATIVLIVISPQIYKLWIGNKVNIPFELTVFIGIFTIISILVNPYSNFINGLGKVKILTIMSPIGIAMFIGFSMLFGYYIHDVYTVALALSLTSIIGMIIIPPVVNKNIA
jgi:O-antigen/teichoic acid export membrane protein